MDCGGVFVKYVLFAFNILFVVLGILLIVFGSIMVSQMGDFTNVEQAFSTNSVSIIIIILGCIVFLIAFMGCCGAIRENACLTISYSVVMLILFICQIVLVAFIWIKRPDILNSMDKVVQKIWEQRKYDSAVMDTMQISFNCCGYRSFADYVGESIPLSCCGASATSCGYMDAMLKPGCSYAFKSFWEKNTDIIRYAGLGVAAVELTAFIFACCLANQMRNNSRRENY